MKAARMTQKLNGWGRVLSLAQAGRFWCLSAVVLLATAATAVAKQPGSHTRAATSSKAASTRTVSGSKAAGTQIKSSRSGATAHHKDVKKGSRHKHQVKGAKKSLRHSSRSRHSPTASLAPRKKSSSAARSRQV